MATFAGTCYVTIYDATHLLPCSCVNCSRKERRETSSHNHLVIKNLRRKHGFPNFQKSRKTQRSVAYRACKADPIPGRSRRGDRSTSHAGSRFRDKLGPQGIRHGSTPGSWRVTRAGWLGSSWQQRASPQRQPRIWERRLGRRPQAPLSCDLRLNHAVRSIAGFGHERAGRLREAREAGRRSGERGRQ